jgi:aminopeptidase
MAMTPQQLETLAHRFMNGAVAVAPGENIWVENVGPDALPLADACAEAVRAAGGIPVRFDSGHAELMKLAELDQDGIAAWGDALLERMRQMSGYIRVTDNADILKLSLPNDAQTAYQRAIGRVHDWRIANTRWLVVAAPSASFADACGMTLPEFEAFYLAACSVDQGVMRRAVEPLRELLRDGKTARIVSPVQGTDLTFSIAGIEARACTGERNLPDGECYTAPVRDTVNGTITFGPSVYQGERFTSIRLRFVDGRAVEAHAETPERTAALNRLLDVDEGARYVGEFALGFNPGVLHPTGSILFDEKIAGSLHLALGRCYESADNGNASANHWDMVQIQRPDYGGGEIWIDDRLIRRDGLFVVPELLSLNPENLKAATARMEQLIQEALHIEQTEGYIGEEATARFIADILA